MQQSRDRSRASSDSALGSSRRVARNAVIRSGGEVVAKLASIAFYVAIARELGTDGFGDFMFALSLTTVLILASGFGTEELITREVARDRAHVHTYLGNVLAIKSVTSVLLLGAAIAIVRLIGSPPETVLAVAVIGLGVAIDNLSRTWYAVFQGYERMEFLAASLVIQRIATAAAGIAVLLTGGGLLAVSVVFTGGAVVGVASAALALRRFLVVPRWKLDRERWLPLVRTATPIGVAGLLFVVVLKIDSVLLGLLTGGANNSEVGIYGAAFRLVEATMFLTWSFAAAVLPWFARLPEDDPATIARGYERGLKLMTAVLMPIGLTFVLLAAPLIQLLYGQSYDGAVQPLQLLGIMTILYGINDIAVTVLIARDRPGDFTRIVAFVAVQNVTMNLLLIPAYGAVGAALSAAFSSALLAVLSVRKVTAAVGAINVGRAFAGPLLGGGAMSAAILLTDPPLVPAVVLGGTAYLVALAVYERIACPDDVRSFVELFRRPRDMPDTPTQDGGAPRPGLKVEV